MSRRRRSAAPLLALVSAAYACAPAGVGDPRAVAGAEPNDNTVAAGTRRGNVVTLDLEARLAAWRPDLDVDSAVTVQVFGEPGGAPRIPGPLLGTDEGSEIRVTVRNSIPG